MVDPNLQYTKEHEWARIEDDIATVGITDHAQELLGEITFVELPSVGDELKADQDFSMVESSKSANDVYAPATGKVIEVNQQLQSKPELINEDPYGNGWICKIRITDKRSLQNLLSAEQYEQLLKEA